MRRVSIVAVAAAAFSYQAYSQERRTVTEAEFLQAFESETHPAVSALGEDLARAEAARLRAGTLLNPRVEYGREQPERNPLQTTWTLAWTAPLDGRLGLAKSAGDAGVDAARQRLAAERLRLRAELRRAFAEWMLSEERRDILAAQHLAVLPLATQAGERSAVGEESGITARRLRLAAGEVAGALDLAEAEARRAEARVRAWQQPNFPPDLRPMRTALPALPPDPLRAERPDIEALRFEARQAELEAQLSRRFVLAPVLQGGWQRLDEAGVVRSGAVFGVSWNVPLFDRLQGARLEARQRREAAEARLVLGESRAKAELEASRAAYATLWRGAREAAAAASGTDALVRGATASFRAGEGSLTDLLDTLRAVREARLRELELYGAALEAHRSLEIAVGLPLINGGSR